MHIIDEYLSLVEDGRQPAVPTTYLFAGKAAPGYWLAKQIIKLIHNVGRVINNDSRASQWIKVAFIPDYRVSLAEKIIPAADISEQISTAGTEASGTGNMKLALNGAVTIGTLDGANIEILEEVGEENMFIFGLKAAEVRTMREQKSYRPWEYYARDPRVKRVVDSFSSNLFCPNEPNLFSWIFASVLDANDEHFHLADFTPYIEAQEKAGSAFRDSGPLDTDGDSERGAHGEVFERSYGRGVRSRYLGRQGDQRRSISVRLESHSSEIGQGSSRDSRARVLLPGYRNRVVTIQRCRTRGANNMENAAAERRR